MNPWTRNSSWASIRVRRAALLSVFCFGLLFCGPAATTGGEPRRTNGSLGNSRIPPWEITAYKACQRHNCDPLLLVAIGRWEPGPRQNQAVGDDGRSFGRYQVLVTTAARHLIGPETASVKRLTAQAYAGIILVLADEEQGADVAARELERCTWMEIIRDRDGKPLIGSDHRFVWRRRPNPWPINRRLSCWNRGPKYIGHVRPIYDALVRELQREVEGR